MRTIRASEIGTYLYCRRAWWYLSQGVVSQNQTEMAAGSGFHREHGRQVFSAALVKLLAWLVLLAAVVALAVALTFQFVR